ncbi:hypothetical protein NUSPORA_01281 [Nucleospora cyclopteri]
MNTIQQLIFLSIDDIEMLVLSDKALVTMMDETKMFFNIIGLEMSKENSATNNRVCMENAQLLEGIQVYKYL